MFAYFYLKKINQFHFASFYLAGDVIPGKNYLKFHFWFYFETLLQKKVN